MPVMETAAKRAFHALFSRAQGASFAVRYWDDSTERFGSGPPRFILRLRDPRLAVILSQDLNVGFGEAYMGGQIEVDGDLADVVSAASHAPASAQEHHLSAILGRVNRRLVRRSERRQREDVAHHYDLSNDFFRLWLDETMTYSCAYFRTPEDTLEQAQRRKVAHSLRKLRLRPGETLLDIGSGWGALVMDAAARWDVQVLGITLSEEQRDASCASIAARGLSDRADVRLLHYDALAKESRQFDKIVSIGMVEHVGKAHLGAFAQAVSRLLRPGGLALLHQITSPEEGAFNAWLDKYIFPGAYLPPLPELLGHLAAHDLRVLDVENLRPHYALTLDHWAARFERVVPQVRQQFGEEFVRMWRLYLRSCAASFREGTVELHQVLVSRGKTDAIPLTRDDLSQ